MMDFPLFYIRNLYGLSYQNIGNVCGVSRQNVMRWENNLLQNRPMIITNNDGTDQNLIELTFATIIKIRKNISSISENTFDSVRKMLQKKDLLLKEDITNQLIYRIVCEGMLGKTTNIFEDTWCLYTILSSNNVVLDKIVLPNIDNIHRYNAKLRKIYNNFAKEAQECFKTEKILYSSDIILESGMITTIRQRDYRITKHIGRIYEKRGNLLYATFDEQLSKM